MTKQSLLQDLIDLHDDYQKYYHEVYDGLEENDVADTELQLREWFEQFWVDVMVTVSRLNDIIQTDLSDALQFLAEDIDTVIRTVGFDEITFESEFAALLGAVKELVKLDA